MSKRKSQNNKTKLDRAYSDDSERVSIDEINEAGMSDVAGQILLCQWIIGDFVAKHEGLPDLEKVLDAAQMLGKLKECIRRDVIGQRKANEARSNKKGKQEATAFAYRIAFEQWKAKTPRKDIRAAITRTMAEITGAMADARTVEAVFTKKGKRVLVPQCAPDKDETIDRWIGWFEDGEIAPEVEIQPVKTRPKK